MSENEFLIKLVQLVGDLKETTLNDEGKNDDITEIISFMKEKFNLTFKRSVPME